MGTFVLLLLVAYFYIWRAGGLDWEEEGSIRRSVSRTILERARPTERIGA